MNIILDGRTDIDNYFSSSGIRENSKLNHTPFITMVQTENEIRVEIVKNPKKLIAMGDDTKVIAQWSGKWQSDFFQFTVSQLKDYIEKNPPESYHII